MFKVGTQSQHKVKAIYKKIKLLPSPAGPTATHGHAQSLLEVLEWTSGGPAVPWRCQLLRGCAHEHGAEMVDFYEILKGVCDFKHLRTHWCRS